MAYLKGYESTIIWTTPAEGFAGAVGRIAAQQDKALVKAWAAEHEGALPGEGRREEYLSDLDDAGFNDGSFDHYPVGDLSSTDAHKVDHYLV